MQKTHTVIGNETTVQKHSWSFELPYPPASLSPNRRSHWAAAAKAKKAFRTRCRALGEAQALAGAKNASGAVLVGLTFFPPDKRARDLDNMLASMKAGLDGLADAMGVDDSRWQLSLTKSNTVIKGGLVLVEIRV